MRWAVAASLAVAFAGCDVIYGLDRHDAGIDAADAPASDGAMPYECNTIATLNDRFDTDELANWWPDSSGTAGAISVSNGRVVLNSLTEDSYTTLDSRYYYDIRERAFTLAMTDDGNVPASSYVNVTLAADRPDRTLIVQRANGNLRFVVHDGSTDSVVTEIPYSAQNHAHLRISVTATSVALSTSVDGVVYVVQGSRPLTGMHFVRATIQVHRPAGTGPFVVYIDEVGDGGPRSPACPFDDLRDDFSTGTLDPQWARSTAFAGQYQVNGGTFLAITSGVPMGTVADVALRSASVFDLEGHAVALEIPQMIMSSPNKQVNMNVFAVTGDQVGFQQQNGTLSLSAQHGPTMLNPYSGPYSATTMRWWRIRNAAGTTSWDVSPDGVSWTNLSSTTTLVGFDRATLDVRTYSAAPDEDVARFDNINVTP